MYNCIKNLFKLGKKSSTNDEKTINVTCLGKEQKAILFVPYGMFISPPDDLLAYVWQAEANEGNLQTMITDLANRDDDLEEGEVKIGVPTLKARMRFTEDDKIKFKIADTEGGDFAVRYNELETAFNQLKQDFDDFVNNQHNNSVVPHTHTFSYNAGPTPAAGTTNTAVITTGNPSTADITPAKVEEIEMPEV